MNEAETRAEHIDPALKAAGWGVIEGSRIRREYPIAPGRIEGKGKRGKALTADYVLVFRNTKLAVVDSDAKCNATSARAHQGKPDFPSSFAAFRWISGMRRRLRGKENREGSKRSGIALRVGIQGGRCW